MLDTLFSAADPLRHRGFGHKKCVCNLCGGQAAHRPQGQRDEAPEVDKADYALEVGGMVDDKKSWTLDQLYALPQETQITRHICVEGWSAIGKWTGVRFSECLRRVGADTRAKYVWFRCAEGYSTSIDMATALHPQTQMTFRFDGDAVYVQTSKPDSFYAQLTELAAAGTGGADQIYEVTSPDDNLQAVFEYLVKS